MANKIVRNITEVKDVNQLAQHVTTQNDLIQTTDGSVYIVTKNGYEQITGGLSQSEITALKSSNTQLKNRVTELETAKDEQATKVSDLETAKDEQDTKVSELETTNSEQTTKISDLETSNTDLITRVEALENAGTTV